MHTTTGETPAIGLRVDERAIVAGTTARYALLLFVLLVSSGAMMGSAFVGTSVIGSAGPDACQLAAGVDPTAGTSLRNLLGVLSNQDAYDSCLRRYAPPLPVWAVLVWPMLVLASGTIVFWSLPAWKRKRGRLIDLDIVDTDGAIRQALTELAATAGLSRVPDIVVKPAAQSTGAVVFGRTGHPVVSLDGGLLTLRVTRPDRFRTVVLHEFAHIANGDTTTTYATIAAWRAFVLVVIVPFLVQMVRILRDIINFHDGPQDVISVAIAAVFPLFLVILVYLTRSDILRSREIFADLTATRWGADIHTVRVVSSDGARQPIVRRLRKLLHTHPEWHLRHASLTDPAPLFAVHPLPVFLVGFTAPLLQLQTNVYGHLPAEYASWLNAVKSTIPATFIVGVTGVALWRAVAYAVVTGRRVPSGLRVGLWLGAGLLAGQLVADQSVLSRWFPPRPEMYLLVFLVGLGFAGWFTQSAYVWTRVWRGRGTLGVFLLIHAVGLFVLANWFDWWSAMGISMANRGFLMSEFLRAAQLDPDATGPTSVLAKALIVAGTTQFGYLNYAIVALWLLPLSAWLVRRRAATAPRWLLRATGDVSVPWIPLPSLRNAIAAGLTGGILGVGLIAVTMACLHVQPPVALSVALDIVRVYPLWVLASLTVGAVIAACFSCVSVVGYRIPIALVSAAISTLIGVISWYFLASVDGCIGPLNVFGPSCAWRPDAAIIVIRAYLPIAAIIIPVAGFGSALIVATATALRKRLARNDRADSIEVIGRRDTGWQRWTAAISSTVAAVVIVVSVALPVWSSRSGSGADEFGTIVSEAPQPQPSILIRKKQVVAWFLVGGRDLMDRLAADFSTLGKAAGDVLDSGDRKISPDAFLPACHDLTQVAADAEKLLPVPNAAAQKAWHTLITQAGTAGHTCELAFEQQDGTVFATALEQLSTAPDSGMRFLATLDTEGLLPNE